MSDVAAHARATQVAGIVDPLEAVAMAAGWTLAAVMRGDVVACFALGPDRLVRPALAAGALRHDVVHWLVVDGRARRDQVQPVSLVLRP